MDRFQRQAVLLMIDSVERQLSGIKSLLHIAPESQQLSNRPLEKSDELQYTSEKEDERIEEALAMEEDRDIFMRDIFREATAAGQG